MGAQRAVAAALTGGYDPDDPRLTAVVLYLRQIAGAGALRAQVDPAAAFRRAEADGDDCAMALLAGPYATGLHGDAHVQAAREVIDRALEGSQGLDALHGVIVAAAQCADPALDERLLSVLDELAARERGDAVRATRAHVQALIARSRGLTARAREWATTAQTAYARCGWAYYAAVAQELAGDLPGARHAFALMGATADARRVEPAPPSPLGGGALSDREDEVARQAARGASNAQIAAALHVSEKTVEKHLSAAYRKLGITRRVELVALLEGPVRAGAQVRLPAPFAPFVGRRAELAELATRVPEYRLVTLSGAGGSGKTRTAIEFARRHAAAFPGGVWFVDLSPVRDLRAVVPTIVGTLAIPELRGDPRSTLLAYLAPRRALLVLDNCEQLVPELGSVLRDILEHAPEVKVLATSRQRIGVLAECVVRLGPMSPPDAIAFFAERAAAGGAPAGDPRRVAAICKRVDCIPLAVELAAARLHDMPLAELEVAVAVQPGVLRSEDAGLARRHRSIDALIESGYALLDERTRAVFRALAVFSAPFSADRAADVLGSPVDAALAVLHRLSLVERLPSGHYRMLLVVRDVALALLRVENEERARFAAFAAAYSSLLEDAYESWFSTPIEAWLAPLREETPNIASAIEWCFSRDGDPACGVALTAIAARVWNELGREPELERYLVTALEHESAGRRTDAVRLWLARARYLDVAHAAPEALAAAERCIALCDDATDERDAALAVLAAGCSHAAMGDAALARPLLERALAMTRSLGIRRAVATALTALAIVADDPHESIDLLAQVLEIAKALDNRLLEGITLANLAEAYGRIESRDVAAHYAHEAVAMLKALGAQTRLMRAQLTLAFREEARAGNGAACRAAAEAFVDAIGAGHMTFAVRAALLLVRGLPDRDAALAARLYGFVRRADEAQIAAAQTRATQIEALLGPPAFAHQLARGARMPDADLAAEVRSFTE